MAEQKQKMVILITRGLDDERASVAWSIANGALATGFELTVFLASSGVDWARKGGASTARLNPLDPTLNDMVTNVIKAGSKVMVCPPCARVRGYGEDDLIDGAVLAGSVAMHEVIKQGAATLSF